MLLPKALGCLVVCIEGVNWQERGKDKYQKENSGGNERILKSVICGAVLTRGWIRERRGDRQRGWWNRERPWVWDSERKRERERERGRERGREE